MHKVKFLKSGVPFGFSYGEGEEGWVSGTALTVLLAASVVQDLGETGEPPVDAPPPPPPAAAGEPTEPPAAEGEEGEPAEPPAATETEGPPPPAGTKLKK